LRLLSYQDNNFTVKFHHVLFPKGQGQTNGKLTCSELDYGIPEWKQISTHAHNRTMSPLIKTPFIQDKVGTAIRTNQSTAFQSHYKDAKHDVKTVHLFLNDDECREINSYLEQGISLDELASKIPSIKNAIQFYQKITASMLKESGLESPISDTTSKEQEKVGLNVRQQKIVEVEPTASNKHHQKFMNAIEVLKQKMEDFKQRPNYRTNPKLKQAYEAADNLYNALSEEGKRFFSNKPSLTDYENFKARCKHHINDAAKVLNQHRGWKKILFNVCAIIITAGIGYAIAAGINVALNRGRCTFFDTDSTKKTSQIKEYVESKECKGVILGG
jgi:hypothetical protein